MTTTTTPEPTWPNPWTEAPEDEPLTGHNIKPDFNGIEVGHLRYVNYIREKGLLHVSPCIPVDNTPNRREGNPELSTEICFGNPTSGVACSNLDDLRFRQFGGSTSLASTSGRAPFRHHVSGVVAMSSEEQMGRVTARRIVAGVTSQHSFGNGSKVDLPREPMGEEVFPDALPRNVKHPVSANVPGASPFPATIGSLAVDTRPEPNLWRCRSVHVRTSAASECLAVDRRPAAVNTKGQDWGKILAHAMAFHRVPRLGLFQQRRGFRRASIIPDSLIPWAFWLRRQHE